MGAVVWLATACRLLLLLVTWLLLACVPKATLTGQPLIGTLPCVMGLGGG